MEQSRSSFLPWMIGGLSLCIVLGFYFPMLLQQKSPASSGGGRNAAEVISLVADANSIVGSPSLSASYIDQKLASVGSPARGIGTALYRLSQEYQIDTAHALAFFHHESSYGLKGVAASTRNFGNIRCSGYACDPTGGYRSYPSWEEGAKDWFSLLYHGYIKGSVSKRCPCTTVTAIIPVYAPAADHNNEAAYISSVLQDVAMYRQEAQA
jgi:hypothetical protein